MLADHPLNRGRRTRVGRLGTFLTLARNIMPHVVVKMVAGRSEQLKRALAER